MKTFTTSVLLVLFLSSESNSQCEIELLDFLYLCDDAVFPTTLDSAISVSGGAEPYTYYWNCFYEFFPGSQTTFDEFDFLDDPTEQFPNLLGSISGDTLVFTLTVTDNGGIICSESISVITSAWLIIMEGCDYVNISSGGSASLCSPNTPTLQPANYQWSPTDYLDDPNLANPIASPPSDMTYCVEITDAIGCQANTCIDVNVGVGVNEYTASSFHLFPNPSNEMLTLQSHLAICKVEISDLTGRIFFTTLPNATHIKLNIESLSTGCYFLTATTEKGIIETFKFLKD